MKYNLMLTLLLLQIPWQLTGVSHLHITL